MGGVRGLSLLLVPVALAGAVDPLPAEVRAKAPGGGVVKLRLVFRRGVQIDAGGVPKAFLAKGKSSSKGWLTFEDLSPEGKRWALQVLWPEDEWRAEEVSHRVCWPDLESVWLLAALFTGHGQNYDQLSAANPKNPEKLAKDDVWRIPRQLLSVDLGGRVKGILDRSQPVDAAKAWLKQNPEPLKAWLEGVTTFDGKDGLAAVQASLK